MIGKLKTAYSFIILTAVILTIFVSNTQAQQSKIVEGGVVSGVPYASTEFENINLTNGNLNFSFPLASLSGRGSAGFGYAVRYDSKIWQTVNTPVYDPQTNANTYQDFLTINDDAGWNDNNSGYTVDIIDRNSGMDAPSGNPCSAGNGNYWRKAYRWKVEMNFPDGGKVEFQPTGYSDIPPGRPSNEGGYFNVHPNGTVTTMQSTSGGCYSVDGSPTYAPMTYYSTDNSGMRLTIHYTSQNVFTWELSLPDGTKVMKLSDRQKIVDRNGNYVESATITLPDSTQASGWIDQFGRYIATKITAPGEASYYQQGFNGELLVWKVKWKKVYVRKNYTSVCTSCPPSERGPVTNLVAGQELTVIDTIELPEQLGELVYTFDYYGKDQNDSNQSPGWGELKSVTTPTEAEITYGYKLSNFDPNNSYTLVLPGEMHLRVDQILKRAGTISNKRLSYTESYDGIDTPKEEFWGYNIGDTSSTVTTPDGSTSTQIYWNKITNHEKGGQVYKLQKSDGTIIESVWANNYPVGFNYGSGNHLNAYVKTEITTIPDNSGNPALITARDYTIDANGNQKLIKEYDFMTYSPGAIPRDSSGIVTGIPSGLTLKRQTVTDYYNSTDTSLSNAYWDAGAPILRSLPKSTEIQSGSSTSFSRTEMTYDYTTYTTNTLGGNPTIVKSWDSTKGVYSNPLGSNSISTSTQYDSYGNPDLITDAKGNQTKFSYGTINGFSGLYPTQTETAYGTAVERTSTAQYDFYTGLVTSVTDVDNNLTNATVYDALGRPVISKTAVNTPLEFWSRTEYDDVNRIVIVRSDLYAKNDGQKIGVQHFDQLGRVRLSRSIENVAAESPYNEQHGIKVETRYQTGNPYSYQVISNPYRAATSSQAASEESMGWTRSKSINTGRQSEIETFEGATLPQPFLSSGYNTNSTGIVRTDIDANRNLVTDQAGKQRISKSNALGQLTDIWEIRASSEASTVSVSFPNQTGIAYGYRTSYTYDTLSNLIQVHQPLGTTGGQTRSFSYSSLSRLSSSNNPESGTISYLYDNNGNLTSKIDARPITTTYSYDALNRITLRDYSDSTPDVTYTYDNKTYAKGKLTKIITGNVSYPFSVTEYQVFDQLGRVTQSQQSTDGTVPDPMTYTYNLSGAMIEQKYPSGRVVRNVLDNDGDISIVQSKKNQTAGYWDYAKSFTFTAAGAVSSMQLGNGKWESTHFNSRLQPTQIALGTVQNGTDKLKLNFTYNTNGQNDNNGNILSQTITVPTEIRNNITYNAFTATQNYSYDSLNRIKQATETIAGQTPVNWQQTFKYDRYGNRTFDEANTTTLPKSCGSSPNFTVCPEMVPLVNPSANTADNRLNSYTFDNSGNTTKDAQSRKFTYDGENKQIKVETVNSGGTVTATHGIYFYDGDGKRVKKISYENNLVKEITIFVYDAGGKMVAEYSTLPNPAPQVSYLTTDQLGSGRINTNENGQVIARHDYQPFGEEVARASYGSDDVKQKFTSYERDEESGLDFAGARYLSNNLARFTSVDPIQIKLDRLIDPQRLNRYIYVRNNPLKYYDPDGRDLKLKEGMKKADVDKIIKNYVKAYRKKSGREAINNMEKSVIVTTVGTGNLGVGVEESITQTKVTQRHGLTKYSLNAAKNEKNEVVITSGEITITYDFDAKQRNLLDYGENNSKPIPESDADLTTHEIGHGNDIINDPVGYKNMTPEEQEESRKKFQETLRNEDDTLKDVEAKAEVEKLFDYENYDFADKKKKKK